MPLIRDLRKKGRQEAAGGGGVVQSKERNRHYDQNRGCKEGHQQLVRLPA